MNDVFQLDDRGLNVLRSVIRDLQPQIICECGSGRSTTLFAHLHRVGAIKNWISLEHLSEFVEATRNLIPATQRNHIIHAPLVPSAYGPWYETAHIPPDPIDFVFIDGPPAHSYTFARHPAIPLLTPYCADTAYYLLDDANRRGEKIGISNWLQLPGVELVQKYQSEHGMVLLKRSKPGR
jgi:hypothetical protein